MSVKAADFSDLFYSNNNWVSVKNSVRKSIGYLTCAFTALLILSLPLYAQGWSWPEKHSN